MAFSGLSFQISCDDRNFCRFLEDIPFTILRRLADIDYCKSLIADRMYSELGCLSARFVFGIRAAAQTSSHTIFECISTKNFDQLIPVQFLLVCFECDYLQ